MSESSVTEDLIAPEHAGQPATQRESAMLILRHGAEAGRRWPLYRDEELLIGRQDDCHIPLPDRQVSRTHARIFWQDDSYFIEDLKSKNGTHLNGEEVVDVSKLDRKSTRLNSSHIPLSRMPSSA